VQPCSQSCMNPQDLCAHAGGVRSVELAPRIKLASQRLAGELATTAKWSPHFPHEHLLVGTVQGHVAVFILEGATDSSQTPAATAVSIVRVCYSAIRCFAWAPPEAFAASPPAYSRSLFAVAAGEGFMAVYDLRRPLTAVMDLTTGSRSALPANLTQRVFLWHFQL
jgi:hypothetical protein